MAFFVRGSISQQTFFFHWILVIYFHVKRHSLLYNKPSFCSLCKEFDYHTAQTFVAFFPKSNFRAIAVECVSSFCAQNRS